MASVWLFSMSVAGRNTVELIQDLTDVVMLTIVRRIDTLLRPAEAQASFLSRLIAGGEIGPDDPQRLLETMAASLAASPQTVVFASADTAADLPKDGFTLVPMGRHGARGRQLEIYRL